MGKHEVGTPKYIANKIKAKGLQKLRWYCQMCQKQCRDENGFKCHISSESHNRQLLLFAEDTEKYLNEFSKEFADGYLELLRRRFGTKRVHANRVYQEYISDRNHLHMNATEWETLTEFVKYLGREGKCVVDETEKGWFVTYIDRDPDVIALQESMRKKDKLDKDDNERMMEFLERQIARGKESANAKPEHVPTELIRKEDETITLDLKLAKKTDPLKVDVKMSSALLKLKSEPGTSKLKHEKPSSKRKTALDEIMEEEESKKKVKRVDHWLAEDIIVKVVTESLGEKYFNKKGEVVEVIDKYAAKVKLLDSNTKIKLDQTHLETVIPAIGKSVKILNGGYRGCTGELVEIDTKHFCATLKISSGPLTGRVVKGIQYEDFSKISS